MRSGRVVVLGAGARRDARGGVRHAQSQRTVKPVLHGRHWVAITGKPLAATAGAMMFQKGGNAVDAACAMLARRLHDVGHARLGRRDAGADLQPEDRRR